MPALTFPDRLAHVRRLYALLDELTARTTGAPRRMSECSNHMRWPERGIYFFYEPGETRRESGAGPRVVRVGTHALKPGARSTLWGRLGQHKGMTRSGGGNHRGSIFRLLIGDALIERDGHGCASWGRGSSAPRAVRAGEHAMEQRVSKVLGAMPVLWLRVDDEPGADSLRGLVERNVIALLSNARCTSAERIDAPSPTWLGHHCSREKVRRSGLWNQRHVDEPCDPSFLDTLEALVRQQDRRRGLKIVIQCAGRKRRRAGTMKTSTGKPVFFVARPSEAPEEAKERFHYARPDDYAEDGYTWREKLRAYNARSGDNPLALLPAYELYENWIYRALVTRFGLDNVLVLSAGWGLLRSSYLTPSYSITFSNQAERHEQRRPRDRYDDFPLIEKDGTDRMIFFGGKSYLEFFHRLTNGYGGERFAFYNARYRPALPGIRSIRYESSTRTNWHYECARRFINGDVSLPD